MWYRVAADAVVVVHLLFIAFVIGGSLLTWRWPKIAWVHIPVAVYGALVEFVGFTCPLTPLENYLRRRSGESGYRGGFIAHYLVKVIYPPGLPVILGRPVGRQTDGVHQPQRVRRVGIGPHDPGLLRAAEHIGHRAAHDAPARPAGLAHTWPSAVAGDRGGDGSHLITDTGSTMSSPSSARTRIRFAAA